MSPDHETDEGIRRFRLGQLAAGQALMAEPPPDAAVITTAGRSPAQVARAIADRIADR